MRTGDQQPPRTEDDLRSALATLERRAPSVEAVLRTVHEAAGRRRRAGLAHTLRAPGPARRRFAAGAVAAAAAAAAAALAVALLPGSPGHRDVRTGRGPTLPRIESRAGLPSAAAVGKTMLTAFSTASDDILYATETGTNRGVLVDVYRDWSWPAQPVTGQQELWREAFWGRSSGTAPLALTEDDGFVYRTPPASADYADGQLTVVCYAGTGQTGCGYGSTETPPGAWSLHYGRFVNPNPGLDDLSPAALAQAIAKGQWRVAGRAHVDGQAAIELEETSAGYYRPLPTLLWVNARTYLPLRMIQGAGKAAWAEFDWHFLRPTPANLALLRVPIPAGYTRSGAARG